MRARETADSRARLVARVAARVERRARARRRRVRAPSLFAYTPCVRTSRALFAFRAARVVLRDDASHRSRRAIAKRDRDARDRPTDRRYMRQHHE
jgi:hypothetical protein